MYIIKLFLFIIAIANLSCAKDELIVGISADYPPFDMIIDGKVSGFDAEIINEIGRRLNKKVIIKDVDFANLIPAINNRTIDVAISNINSTPERRKAVDFSIPYYRAKIAIIYSKAQNFSDFSTLKGHKIGVQLGTVFEEYIRDKNAEIELISLARVPILIEELKLGNIDYLLIDQSQAEHFTNFNKNFIYKEIKDFNGELAIATLKNSALTKRINQALEQMDVDGTIAQLIDKWIVEDNLKPQGNNYDDFIYIIKGSIITLIYAIISAILGLLISLSLTFISRMNLGGRLFARFYISIIRGTPLILQLSIIYFVLPEIIGKKIPIFLAGLIGFSINSAAYIFEHIRAGINSIDEGQIIAARSMGINDKIITRKIIMPQALKNITPSIINEIINLIKETSIISIFGVADIMRRANIIAAEQYNYLSPLIMAGICYYSLISIMSYLLNFIERRLGKKHA